MPVRTPAICFRSCAEESREVEGRVIIIMPQIRISNGAGGSRNRTFHQLFSGWKKDPEFVHATQPDNVPRKPRRTKLKSNSCAMVFLYGAVLGAAAFLLSFGWHVLEPERIGWLLQGGDLNQHFLGWMAFRNSPWKFPFCLTDQLTFPYDASIVFTDSIPLFALPFKLFRSILPERFQYFGLFGFCCFLLQGGFAALLLRRFTNHLLPSLAGTLFFLFVPALSFRMFYHTSLAAQWTILAGFAIWLYTKPETPPGRILILWVVLGCISIAIHPTLAAMICGLFMGQMLHLIHQRRSIRPMFGAAAYVILLALFFFAIGGFHGISRGEGKFGSFGANLNTFYNPLQPDALFRRQPILTGQYEGLAFLGAGMLVMVLLACFLRVTRRPSDFRRLTPAGFRIPFLLICVLFFLYGLSIKVTWNEYVLYTIPLPASLIRLCDIFRAAGRFMWVPMYALMLFATATVLRNTPRKRRMIILTILLALQGFGLHPMIRETFERFRDPAADPTPDPVREQFMDACRRMYASSSFFRLRDWRSWGQAILR